MKRRLLAVSLVLAACLACSWVASVVCAGPLIGSVKGPDLVITDLTLHGIRGRFRVADLKVTVKNIGGKPAAPCAVDVWYTSNVTGPGPFGASVVQTPTLAPKASAVLQTDIPLVPAPWKGMLIAAVDVPVPGKPTGQVGEGGLTLVTSPGAQAAERNNVFGFVFDTSNVTYPKTWTNPAAQ